MAWSPTGLADSGQPIVGLGAALPVTKRSHTASPMARNEAVLLIYRVPSSGVPMRATRMNHPPP
jgi:hypothetical protein